MCATCGCQEEKEKEEEVCEGCGKPVDECKCESEE